MNERVISYTEGDDSFDAFVAAPAGDGTKPAVLVCHAWGGRDEFAENKARALAELGYVGVAVDVYGVGKRGTDNDSCAALMTPLLENPNLLRRRLAAAFQAVRTQNDVDPDRVASIGFCFGGLCSLLMARMGLPLRGATSFHGLLKVGEPLDTTPKARMCVLHGQDDPMVPPQDVGAWAAEMKRVGGDWQLHAYPGVAHAFTVPEANDADSGMVYDAGADARSWATAKAFLAEVLG
ncbi:MAG: dienelactone hydrolase family protein [Nannocystaceae bacterium]|nr:dienelactone hydrolase family protein [Nannocystaceae bacterium]